MTTPMVLTFAALLFVSIPQQSTAQGTCDWTYIAADVQVPGGSHFSRSVWALIKASVIGQCFDDQTVGRLSRDVSDTLHDIGYINAIVSAPKIRVIDSTLRPQSVLLSFEIRQGERYRVQVISIAGNQVLDADQIRSVCQVELGEFLNMSKVSATSVAIQRLYAANGFPSAQAVPDTEVLPGTGVRVVFTIREGPPS